MSSKVDDIKYANSHEWLRLEGENLARVGISAHAAEALGDIVFVDLPRAGASVAKGSEVGVIESVKTASDIYSPVSGDIVEVNSRLLDSPDLINESPLGDGWLYTLRLADADELEALLDPDAYEAACQ